MGRYVRFGGGYQPLYVCTCRSVRVDLYRRETDVDGVQLVRCAVLIEYDTIDLTRGSGSVRDSALDAGSAVHSDKSESRFQLDLRLNPRYFVEHGSAPSVGIRQQQPLGISTIASPEPSCVILQRELTLWSCALRLVWVI